MRLRLLPAALLLVLTTACQGATDTANKVQDCAALAQDAAAAGLDRVPSRSEAESAVRRLDERIANLKDEQVKNAAATLRDRLREVVQATRNGDPQDVQQAVAQARDAARDTARTCGLPADRFGG